MADEMRTMTGKATEETAGGRTIGITPDDPGAVRSEIEATRARMSETIDEIEDVIIRKKQRIQDRLDVMGMVRDRPVPTLGAIFGAGLVLGLVTGGGDDEGESRREVYGPYDRYDPYAGGDRAAEWEGRARRLLAIAQEQEQELERLRAHHERHHHHDGGAHPEPHAHSGGASSFDRFQERAAERLTELVRDSVRGLLRGAG